MEASVSVPTATPFRATLRPELRSDNRADGAQDSDGVLETCEEGPMPCQHWGTCDCCLGEEDAALSYSTSGAT